MIAGSDPEKCLFLQVMLNKTGAEKVLACTFGGQKGVF